MPRPLRDHLAVASGEAEHRQVTVSFLKLSGTDAAIEDGTLLAMLDELAVAVGQACETYGLTWLESDIDVGAVKLYLTGGAPSSSGDDEEGMVRALRDVIAACPDLPLRAGVNRGHVFTGDIGNPAPPHLRRDGRRRQPRGPAHGPRAGRAGSWRRPTCSTAPARSTPPRRSRCS